MTTSVPSLFRSTERSLLSRAARLIAVAAVAAGCAAQAAAPDPETGKLIVPLVQPGPDGSLYQLTHATFEITSDSGFAATLDGTSADSELELAMPPGLFQLRLDDGWTLAKSTDGGATFQPLDALLGSSNPQVLRILANQPLTVECDFLVRSASGTLQLKIGVTEAPRELAGGFLVSSATDDLAAYATENRNLDFAIFFDPSFVGTRTLDDGTRQRIYQGGGVGAVGPMPPFFSPVAAEIYGDRLGLLTPIFNGASGAFLEFEVSATPAGPITLQGTLDSGDTQIAFGPHAIAAVTPTLDADGFPRDEFFYDSTLPFTLSGVTGSITGTLRMRYLLPNPQ